MWMHAKDTLLNRRVAERHKVENSIILLGVVNEGHENREGGVESLTRSSLKLLTNFV